MIEMNKDLDIQSNWPLPLDPIDTPCKLAKSPSSRPTSRTTYSHAPTPLIIPEPTIPPYEDDPISESALSQSTDALHALLDDSESDSEPDSDMESDIDLEGPDPVVESPLSSLPPSPPLPTRPTFSSPLTYSCTSFEESQELSDDTPDSCHTYTIQYSPPRHQYTNHGYSRHGFTHIRRFWELREDAWAYDGYAPEPSEDESITPPSMHPRRGDVSALRDPYCAHVDRCFAKLPVWTMSKTLWMFDIHVGATREKPKVMTTDSETENEEEMMGSVVSVKTKASEDSDATLVESESEDGWSVVSPSQSSPVSPCRSAQPSRSPSCYFEEESPKKLFVEEEEEDSSDEEDEEEYACVPRVWATNWYRRWELLIRLVRLDQERKRARAAKLLARAEFESDPEGVGT